MTKNRYFKNIIKCEYDASLKKVRLKGKTVYLLFRRNYRISEDELITKQIFYYPKDALDFLKNAK